VRLLSFALFALLTSIASAQFIVLSGGRSGSVPSSGDAWWLTESTKPGVLVASRLDTQTIIDDWLFDDASNPDPDDNMSLDTVLKFPGAAGSLKHTIDNDKNAGAGQFSVPIGTEIGNGEQLYFAYGMYLQPNEAYAPWAPDNSAAAKLSILSRDGNGTGLIGSNQLNEFVFQLNYQGGKISAYHRCSTCSGTGDGIPQFDFGPIRKPENNVCSASDNIDTPDLDFGTTNPLTGTNPDTGAAWSACQQLRAQYSGLHSSSLQSIGVDYQNGLGDAFGGGFRAKPRQWITVAGAVSVGTFGTNSSRLLGFAAYEGEAYELLFDVTDQDLGDEGANDYNGLNLLPYTTNRTGDGRHVSARGGELEACFEIWNVSPTHSTGVGTLSWDFSDQRMTWDASGDSPGTARGFSEANDILARNLTSSTSTNFINGEFTPADCPGTDTSESVTIATERDDTQRNYGWVIISTEPIDAPPADPLTTSAGFDMPVTL
jgi:hypothetical protein